MADTAVANVALSATRNILIDTGIGTAIVHANTHVITPSGPLEEGILIVQNTTAGAKTFTVLAGDNPPADAAGLGNLAAISVAQGDSAYKAMLVSGLSSSRHLQDNGTLRVSVEGGMTGWMYWYQIPRR
jgi:hypothetical protein